MLSKQSQPRYLDFIEDFGAPEKALLQETQISNSKAMR
jgi:hypothetical protein